MGVFVLAWIGAAAAYVLFAGQFGAEELATAVICGLVAGLWSAALRRVASVRLRFERGAIGAAGRALAGVPMAATKVAARLVRASIVGAAGEVVTQPFFHGRRDDHRDAGRRAVAILARSLAPDSFVLRAPEQQDEIVIHTLVETAGGEDARWAI